jgi:Leucine-rich repeat (LRR) protein
MSLFFLLSSRKKDLLIFILLITLVLLQPHAVTPENRDLTFNSNDNNKLLTSQEHQPTESSLIQLTHEPSADNSNPTITSLSSQGRKKYACLRKCECSYDSTSLRLEITCSGESTFLVHGKKKNNEDSAMKIIDISPGIRTLVLRNLTLDLESSRRLIPSATPIDSLEALELVDVTIDPFHILTKASSLLQNSRDSLRQLSIRRGTLPPDFPSELVILMDYRDTLNTFASLRKLDSLVICDSQPPLAQLILQALPPVSHIRVLNSSLEDLFYLSFSQLGSSLLSLNLSNNHLHSIPTGLLDTLSSLQTLDVSHNRIMHLQEDVFSGLTSIRDLDLSHNVIEYVDAEVFTPLKDLYSINLSHNEVIQFFKPYFQHNGKLNSLLMANTWIARTFLDEATADRSFKEMEGLINTLRSVKVLDLSDNQMRIIPETLSHAPKLERLNLWGNPWECNCDDRWVLEWISTTNVSLEGASSRGSINDTTTANLSEAGDDKSVLCHKPNGNQFHLLPYLQELSGHCNSSNIIARTPFKFYAVMGKDAVLSCHVSQQEWPKVRWITPSKNHISANNTDDEDGGGYNSNEQDDKVISTEEDLLRLQPHRNRQTVKPNGTLIIDSVTGADYGLYLCIASYQDINITHYVHLGVDVSIFQEVRITSIIVGLIFSFGFLFLVLLGQFIKYLLIRYEAYKGNEKSIPILVHLNQFLLLFT